MLAEGCFILVVYISPNAVWSNQLAEIFIFYFVRVYSFIENSRKEIFPIFLMLFEV